MQKIYNQSETATDRINRKNFFRIFLADAPDAPLPGKLLIALGEKFEINESLQYVHRPGLFTLDHWRISSFSEFDHLGSRPKVRRALKWLAWVGYVHLDLKPGNPNQFYVRLPAATNFKPQRKTGFYLNLN